MTSEGWGDALYLKNIVNDESTNSTGCSGGFCNHLFRNIPISQICKKNNLAFDYSFNDEIIRLGIPLFSGTNKYDETILVNDKNFLDILNSEIEQNILFENKDVYFQTKEISLYLFFYLQSIKELIFEKN
jgi:hypothetical protein